MLECKVCEFKFNAMLERHYITRDNEKNGLSTVVLDTEAKIYDTFDCPNCGCQVIVQERKRTYDD